MTTKTTVYQIITDRLIERMEAGVNPWVKPWNPGTVSSNARNMVTGTVYRGINSIMTNCSGFNSPFWLTFKQAQGLGGNVKKGSKGTPIVYWARIEKDGAESEGFMFARYYTVFNLDQIEGITAPVVDAPKIDFDPIAEAEAIAAGYAIGPQVKHQGDKAVYFPSMDLVCMPPRETFLSPSHYYATLFHELAHSTGHRTRLNRDSLTKLASFGSHEYSKEELVAEFCSSFLVAAAGIDSREIFDNSASYLAGWIKALKNDSKLVIQAASAAQKAADRILGIHAAPETENA